MKALALFAPMLCVVAVVVAIHGRRASTSPPAAEPATPVTMDVRSVAPGPSSSTEPDPAAISASIATLCGADPATADRYEARNDALRSIARERNLQEDDVAALTAWIASTNDVLHTERLAALKNDVMNLLRRQESPPPDFADTLIAMFESEAHPPVVLDYCIQHLGAMLGDIADGTAGDIPLLRRFATMGPRYATAADADGNMTADGSGWHYAWNGENRMVCASNDDVLVTYEYDHRGRMVRKEISSRDTETQSFAYVWDDWNILRETLTTKVCSSVSDNIWGLDINGAFQGAGGIGGLLAVIHENN